jgi:uncharacterized membrane protein
VLTVVLAGLLILYAAQVQVIGWHLIVAISSMAGLYHSFLVYKLEEALEFTNERYRKCNIYNGFDCFRVFSSKWGRMFGLIRLSYCGIIHFSTITILTLFSLLAGNTFLNLLLYLLIGPVLFVPYSLLTQWLLIKSWCLNCIKVQASLTLNAVFAFFMLSAIAPLTIQGGGIFLLLLTSTILLFESSRVAIERIYRYKTMARELQTLKTDPRVFTSLHAQAQEELPPPEGFRFIVGDDRKNEVTVIISPYCPACAETVCELQRQLLLGQVHFHVNLLISASRDNTQSRAAQILITLLYTKAGPQQILQTLIDWFDHQDIDKLLQQHGYQVGNGKEKAERMMETSNRYLNRIQAYYTPLLLLQNKPVSPRYSFTELAKILK